MKENKLENLVWSIFAIIGTIFIVIGIFVSFQVLKKGDKIETMGVITQISSYRQTNGDRGHEVYVSYMVNGEEYESKLNSYSSSFYEGKEIDIYYHKNNPHEIGSSSLDFLVLLFPGIGFIFAIIGGIGLFVKMNKKKKIRKLRETGDIIHANYMETTMNTSYSVNGRHPYNIICEWNNPADSKKYFFKSENIWMNPENKIEEKNIKTFPVYINPENIQQYVIDIDSIVEN